MTPEELLEEAWLALEDGRPEEALALAARLPADDEALLLAARARLDVGDLDLAERDLARAAELRGEDGDVLVTRADLLFARGEPAQAGRALRSVPARELAGDAGFRADVHARLAMVHDFAGEPERARAELSRAHRADPARHRPPFALSDADFDDALDSAARELPDQFARVLEEIPVIVEPMPALSVVREGHPPDLLGLWDPGHDEAPPRILLFQRNLERAFPDRGALVREIRTTLYHELGHALGFDEEGLEEVGLE